MSPKNWNWMDFKFYDAYRHGVASGLGLAVGKTRALQSLVDDGILTLDEAAQRAGTDVIDFRLRSWRMFAEGEPHVVEARTPEGGRKEINLDCNLARTTEERQLLRTTGAAPELQPDYERGQRRGEARTYRSLIDDGVLTEADAAQRMGTDVATFRALATDEDDTKKKADTLQAMGVDTDTLRRLAEDSVGRSEVRPDDYGRDYRVCPSV